MKSFTFLSLFTSLIFQVHAGYSAQDCGIAWAPNINLVGHPPMSHPGYYCKNSGGVEYGCEVCHTFEHGVWHACHYQPSWGFQCGLQSEDCGFSSSDCRDVVTCTGGYSYYGIYAHCWNDSTRFKCVPAEHGRAITHTVCSKCLVGTASSRGPT